MRRNLAKITKAAEALNSRMQDSIRPVETGEVGFEADDSPGLNLGQRMYLKAKLDLAVSGGKLESAPDVKALTFGQARAILTALGLDPDKLNADRKQRAWLGA